MASEERLIDIEARIAHQEQSILQLGDEVFQQQKQLGQMQATCEYLLERIKALSEGGPEGDADDAPPPHY